MRPIYHQSEIGDFLICGKRWYFRHVAKIQVQPTTSLTLGSAVDDTVSVNFRQKVESKVDLPLQQVLDFFSTNFDRRARQTDWRDDSPDVVKDLGVKLVTLHHEQIAPKIQPVAVQQRFHIELNGRPYDFGGTIDLIDSDGWVRDTKTAARSYSEHAVSRAIQPAMYDFSYRALNGTAPRGFIYDVLVKTQVPKVQQVSGQVEREDHQFLFDAADALYDHVAKGVLPRPASEENQLCSEKYCPFWAHCKGKKCG